MDKLVMIPRSTIDGQRRNIQGDIDAKHQALDAATEPAAIARLRDDIEGLEAEVAELRRILDAHSDAEFIPWDAGDAEHRGWYIPM